MKTETFSKTEMLHHFENLMPKNHMGKTKYVSDSNFLPTCAKLNLVKCLNRRTSEYVFVKPFISEADIKNIITSLKANYKKGNIVKRNKQSIIDLDEMAKKVAASGLYKIENGKVFKQMLTWVEL